MLATVVDLRHGDRVPGPDHTHLEGAVVYVVRAELERDMREWCQVQAQSGFLRVVTTERDAATAWAESYRRDRVPADPEGNAMRATTALIRALRQTRSPDGGRP